MTKKKSAIMGALAPMFNALLGIDPGYFGSSPARHEPGAGVLRARAREVAQRRQQALRLANAALPEVTRQQRRYARRCAAKGRAA